MSYIEDDVSMRLHHGDFETFERLSSAELRALSAHALLYNWLHPQSLFSSLHSKAIFTGLWGTSKAGEKEEGERQRYLNLIIKDK